MNKKLRLFLAVLLLAVSLSLLVWASLPGVVESRVVPVPPGNLELPTPSAFIAYWVV
jgi:hypothetical protein